MSHVYRGIHWRRRELKFLIFSGVGSSHKSIRTDWIGNRPRTTYIYISPCRVLNELVDLVLVLIPVRRNTNNLCMDLINDQTEIY